jgi:DNA-binding MarR family transcriptional regulator
MTRAPRVDYRALANFRYEMRRFLRISEDAARAAGLEPQQHQLMLAIKGAPPDVATTITYLAERLQLKHHSVVGLVDRLEGHRYVERHRDPSDERRAVVTLTDDGEATLHDLSLLHQEEIRSRARQLVSSLVAIVRANPVRR